MAELKLLEFEHDPKVARGYLGLARRLHADDPNWVAPGEQATTQMLGPRNPFFKDEANRHRGFALQRGGELVGHVLATVNHRHNLSSGQNTGALGFLEVEPDYETFDQLISPALRWLSHEGHASRVWANMNFDIWHGYRVMTRGFDLPPFLGEPRNGSWLPGFLERAGFDRCKGWVSATTSREFLIDRAPYFRERHDTALMDGYQIRELQFRSPEQIDELHRVVNQAFRSFYGYTPIGQSEFASLVGGVLRHTGTDLATALEDPEGETVGFSIAFADPMPLLKRMDGHDGWMARWRAFFGPSGDRALHYMIGVLPEARSVHQGLGSALMYDTLRRILDGGYSQTTFALMADDSPARFFALDQTEIAEREYALYERSLPAADPA